MKEPRSSPYDLVSITTTPSIDVGEKVKFPETTGSAMYPPHARHRPRDDYLSSTLVTYSSYFLAI